MLFAVDHNDRRVHIKDTYSNREYYCPYCGAPLITRKGEIRQHHFAHKSNHLCADTWERSNSYDISEWHNEWQEQFPKENQEVCLSLGETRHRADVLIGKTVVEFQHSIMSISAFDDRNNFYFNLGYKVVWLFDLTRIIEKGDITYSIHNSGLDFFWKNPKKAFNSYDIQTGSIDLFFQISNEDPCIVRVTDISRQGFERFRSSPKMERNEFLEYLGVKDGLCALPDRGDLSKNQSYLAFKEKYHIQLNQQQERALQAIEGANLLLAVPGSGKTTVLVSRLGYMVYEKGIDPQSILAITFSKSAADEMQVRFSAKFGQEIGKQISFRTINSLSLEIYTSFCKSIGKPIRKLIEENKLKVLYREIYQKTFPNSFPSESDILELGTAIAYAKNMMLSQNQVEEMDEDYPKFSQMYQCYNDYLTNNNLMDFDDQMRFAYSILDKREKAKTYWQQRYKYICVDEAQDTSKIQHMIIRILSFGNNLFMVGDEDQSIYGFRAAYPKALLNFRFDYNNPYILRMERNYRSTKQIVEKAQTFISMNTGRYRKIMVSDRGDGEPVELIEVASVGEQYTKLLEVAKSTKNETAFLYRDNESSVVLVDLLLRNDVHFSLKKPEMNFFGHSVVLDIVAYLSIAINSFDAESFNRICNKGIIYLKKDQREYAVKNCKYKKVNIFDAVEEQMQYVTNDKKHRADSFRYTMELVSKQNAADAIQTLLNHGYGEYLDNNHLDRSKADVLILLARQESDIQRFLQRLKELELVIAAGFQKNKDGLILLSTIHSSKGQEYETVYMVDVYNGRFPSSRHNPFNGSKDNADGEQEERRLFYVGITRAKNNLHLFSIKGKDSSYIEELYPEVTAKKKLMTEVQINQQLLTGNREADRRKEYLEQQKKLQAKKRWTEGVKALFDGYNEVKNLFTQQDEVIKDSHGVRWVKCKKCERILPSDDFVSYGGRDSVNLGICTDCAEKEQ